MTQDLLNLKMNLLTQNFSCWYWRHKKTFIKSNYFKMCKVIILKSKYKKIEIENDERNFKDQCFIEIINLLKNCITY